MWVHASCLCAFPNCFRNRRDLNSSSRVIKKVQTQVSRPSSPLSVQRTKRKVPPLGLFFAIAIARSHSQSRSRYRLSILTNWSASHDSGVTYLLMHLHSVSSPKVVFLQSAKWTSQIQNFFTYYHLFGYGIIKLSLDIVYCKLDTHCLVYGLNI